MLQPITCIALRTIRLNDKQNLLSAWSRESGRITLAMPAGAGREASRRRALTRPLYCFEGVADIRPQREIHTIRDLRPHGAVGAVRLSVVKDMVGIFIAEVLDLLLRQASPDPYLSQFLFESVELLHEAEREEIVSYFPVLFLLRLTEQLGVGPDFDTPGSIFDLREGRFTPALPLHRDFADSDAGADLRALAACTYSTAPVLAWSRVRRNEITDILLRYLSIHIAPLTSLHSLSTLRNY